MVWIKVCGITSEEDAWVAVACGADALGFVFAPSIRNVTAELAREIIKKLPDNIEKIGVFVNESPEKVRNTANFCGLTSVQLHGDEKPEYSALLSDLNIIKAFRIIDKVAYEEIEKYSEESNVSRILLDTYSRNAYGGTGEAFFWRASVFIEKLPLPLILAGGLTAENIEQAITIVRPYVVDVSSGVEKAPGQKDLQKLKTFIERARRVS